MIKYILLMVLTVTFFGGVVPFVQFVIEKRKHTVKVKRYIFPMSLFEKNIDENLGLLEGQRENRLALGDRGWMRKPMGEILKDEDFEEKKKKEYIIELP